MSKSSNGWTQVITWAIIVIFVFVLLLIAKHEIKKNNWSTPKPSATAVDTGRMKWHYFSESMPGNGLAPVKHPVLVADVSLATKQGVVFSFPFRNERGEQCHTRCAWLPAVCEQGSYRSTDGSRSGLMSVSEVRDGKVRGYWKSQDRNHTVKDNEGQWVLIREDILRKEGNPL